MEIDMTREEAIKELRGFIGQLTEGCQEVIKVLVPELRESEDERIRKELIAILKKSYNSGITLNNKKDLDEYLAYLEKQKENPKSADSTLSDCMADVKCEDRWHKVGDSLPDNPREVLCKDEAGNYFIGRYYVGEGWEISNYDDEDKPHHLNPPVSKWIDFPSEKQKESLHDSEICKENADSFTDGIIEVRSFQRGIEEGRRREKQKEQTSDIILKAFENSKTDYSLEEREEASDYSEKVLPTSIACGESDEEFLLHKVIEAAYIAGQKEQKPPIAGNDFGWIDELKHDLEHQEELDQKVQEILKKRQKPVEQDVEKYPEDKSFEDEWKDYYNSCLVSRLPMNKREVAKHFYWLAKKNAWKPSEEQMKILNWAANGMVDKSIAAPEMRAVLRELYEQLKKLM